MPSLFGFLIKLAIVAALCFGAMSALAYLVEPREREMTINIPVKRLNQ